MDVLNYSVHSFYSIVLEVELSLRRVECSLLGVVVVVGETARAG